MNEKNIKTYIKVLFGINAVTIAAVGGIIYYLFSSIPAIDTEMAADDDNLAMATIEKSPEQKTVRAIPAEEISVAVNDEGFDPQGIQTTVGQQIKFIVKNTGAKSHSFIIDELNADSGVIAPSETKEVVVDFKNTEAKNYQFHSMPEDDTNENFNGLIMVLEK